MASNTVYFANVHMLNLLELEEEGRIYVGINWAKKAIQLRFWGDKRKESNMI